MRHLEGGGIYRVATFDFVTKELDKATILVLFVFGFMMRQVGDLARIAYQGHRARTSEQGDDDFQIIACQVLYLVYKDVLIDARDSGEYFAFRMRIELVSDFRTVG